MDNKILEIFIPGPAGRLEAKYYKSKKNTSPIALVLQASSSIWRNYE
jgi:alpha/beta superfamily hydrolase